MFGQRREQVGEHYSLILLEANTPEVDGFAVASYMAARTELADSPIVLTALESRKEVIAGLDAGADDYIVKPFDRDELRAPCQRRGPRPRAARPAGRAGGRTAGGAGQCETAARSPAELQLLQANPWV
jgi:DNA-binding response OmpR family regulator